MLAFRGCYAAQRERSCHQDNSVLGLEVMSTKARVFGPLVEGNAEIGKPCPACQKPFAIGQYTTLVALGPSDDPEQQALARDGRPYIAVAIQAHYACVTGIEPPKD